MTLAFASLLLLVAEPDFGWLAGHWCTVPKAGSYSCETWAPMEKGVMRGTSVSYVERATTSETMWIAVDGSGLFFHAEPASQAPTDFRAVAVDHDARSVVFENRSHDYPQRIRYWREGELLMAEIALADGGKPMRWTFHRMAQ